MERNTMQESCRAPAHILRILPHTIMRIALLDDNVYQSALVRKVLSATGHACLAFVHSCDMLQQLRSEDCDMLILNWQRAEQDSIEMLRWAREKIPHPLPVLIITDSADEDDILAALAAGADDYLCTPVRRSELASRVQVLLRRTYPHQDATELFRFGRYTFEACSGQLRFDDASIALTQKEFTLALLFFRNLDRPLSRATILEAVWSRHVDIPSRTMDTHVSRVRSKLKLRPENGFRLAPVYSYGYRLEQL